jgi:hypothetical protein
MHYLRRQEGIKRAMRVIRVWRMIDFVNHENEDYTLRWMLKTRKPCSCAMCGNPRKYFKGKDKLTMQERRANAH